MTDRTVSACPVCGQPAGSTVFAAARVPVLCNQLLPSADEARRAATGSIDLVMCASCGLLWNASFDERIVRYSPAYENSLHFSPHFQGFATQLAHDLVHRNELCGRTVIEIGSGKGDFLAMLRDAGIASGIGYDPSYAGETPSSAGLRFVPSLFPDREFPQADFVCARHVFEHLSAPARVLGAIRRAIPAGQAVGFYIEVPDGSYLLREVALWDVIYEHPLHFTGGAMIRLFEGAGIGVTRLATSFGGQYLSIEGWTTARAGDAAPLAQPDRAGLDDLASTFRARAAELRSRWAARLAALYREGAVVLWGAGSKGVSFLATVPGAEHITAVVDVNPRKHGRHVPVTGQEVVAPDALRRLRPRVVVLLNPVYRDEVASMLAGAGSAADLVTGATA